MLLPKDPELEKLSPDEDPRRELVERLLEHERFKNAAEMLQQKRMIEENVWSNPRIEEFLSGRRARIWPSRSLIWSRLSSRCSERARQRPVFEVDKEDVSVPDMVAYLKELLKSKPRNERIGARGAVREAAQPAGHDLPVPGDS